MAKTKESKAIENITTDKVVAEKTNIETSKVKKDESEIKTTKTNGPTYDELLSIIQTLSQEVQSLKTNQVSQVPISQNNSTDKLIELLANRKSDKEVDIVHNRELLGGLTTHIDLTGMTIDFRGLGEHRILSWAQFEECVSKYRSFFEKEIILLGDEHSDLSERYNIPCIKRQGNHVITQSEIQKLPKLSRDELREYVEGLSQEDKDFVFSYWLGKCYNKEDGFYDRYKIEMLNLLSGEKVFDNLLAFMNGDYRND